MPMGIVSDDEFNAEIERQRVEIIPSKPLGRGNGNKQVPDSLRKIIGENAIGEGNEATKVMTRALGISDSSLSAYKAGATSTATYNNPVTDLANHVDNARQRVIKKARSRLLASLNNITPAKLKEEKPRDLAGIAKDMSIIIRNMEPQSNNDGKTNQPLIIFAPQLIHEDKFEVIDAEVE